MRVVFVIRNDELYIAECIQSVRHLATSCVVKNQNSTDSTLSILLKSFPDAIIDPEYCSDGLYIDGSMKLCCRTTNDENVVCYNSTSIIEPHRSQKDKGFEFESLREHDEDEIAWFKIYMSLKSNVEKNATALMALFQTRKHRIEPLYHLIKHLRISSSHNSAFALALMCLGKELELEHDNIGIEYEIYDWGLLYELSIIAFYVNELSFGLQVCNQLLKNPRCKSLHHNIKSNMRYYIQPLKGLRPHEISSALKPHGWFLFNPSLILIEKSRLMINVRCVNAGHDFKPLNDQNQRVPCSTQFPLTSTNIRMIADIDANNTEIVLKDDFLFESQSKPESFANAMCKGLEDCRLFEFNGKTCFLATSQEFNKQHVNCMYLGYGYEYVVPIESPQPGRYEKNWLPFSNDDKKLLAIYSFSPFRVLEIDHKSGQTSLYYFAKNDWDQDIRGSAGPVLGPDGYYYCIVHQVINPGRIYVHRAVRFTKEFKDMKLSHQFKLKREFDVEYVCGLAFNVNTFFITWGENDEKAYLSGLPFQDMTDLFR